MLFSSDHATAITAQPASYEAVHIDVGTQAVSCKCSLTGDNTDCLANNLGASCAPDGSPHCRDWDDNCGDGDCGPDECDVVEQINCTSTAP